MTVLRWGKLFFYTSLTLILVPIWISFSVIAKFLSLLLSKLDLLSYLTSSQSWIVSSVYDFPSFLSDCFKTYEVWAIAEALSSPGMHLLVSVTESSCSHHVSLAACCTNCSKPNLEVFKNPFYILKIRFKCPLQLAYDGHFTSAHLTY